MRSKLVDVGLIPWLVASLLLETEMILNWLVVWIVPRSESLVEYCLKIHASKRHKYREKNERSTNVIHYKDIGNSHNRFFICALASPSKQSDFALTSSCSVPSDRPRCWLSCRRLYLRYTPGCTIYYAYCEDKQR